jgi:hypothetical protein
MEKMKGGKTPMIINVPPKILVMRAVRQMSPALREQYDTVRRLLANATAADIRTRYRVGHVVLDIRQREDRYGTKAVALLAAALGRDETTLYRYAIVAETWSENEVGAMLQRKMPTGEPITWSHLMELATVSSRDERERLFRLTVSACLSVRALAIQVRGGSRVPVSGAARPLSRLAKIARVCETVERTLAIDEAFLDKLATLDGGEAVAAVRRALASQDAALRAIERNRASLRRTEARIQKLVAATARQMKEEKSVPRLLAGGMG